VAAEEMLARTRARADEGAAIAIDVALAERERAEAEADLARAYGRESSASAALRSALDLDADAEVNVDAPGRPDAVSRDEARRAAVRAPRLRGDATALDEQAARSDASATRAARAAIAPLVLGFEAQQVAVGPQELDVSIGASLRWELPLVQRAQGDRAIAEAEARGTRLGASLLRRQIERDVVAAAEALDRNLAELDSLERGAIPAAERTLQATEAAFAAGALDSFRVIDARRTLLALRARALDVLGSAWQSRLAYDRACGVVDER
jgi:outer membrane protein TolC